MKADIAALVILLASAWNINADRALEENTLCNALAERTSREYVIHAILTTEKMK